MFPVVEIRQPGQTTLFVSVRGPLELGRECNGVLLADPQVSRRHLSLDVLDGAVVVTDLGSTNGSTIDGRPLTSPTTLSAGRVVRLGETEIALDDAGASGFNAAETLVVEPNEGLSKTITREAVAVDSTEAAARPTPPAPPAPPRPATAPARLGPSPSDQIGRSSIDIVAAQARTDGVDLRSLPADHGTITIVFSDIESSTERNVELGDRVWFSVLEAHNRVVARRVAQHHGTIVKNQGDGFMLSFSGARRALDCMVAVQRDLDRRSSEVPERSVRVRIGMHTGEVLTDADGDLFGQHVVVAARVANLADGGEILVSSLTKEIVASRGDVTFGPPRSVDLKGIGDAVVYPIEWQEHDQPERGEDH